MLGKVLIWAALLDGALKGAKEGLRPPPLEPPEGIGIWWCKECNRWQPWQDDNPALFCYYHKKPVTMQAHAYVHGGPIDGQA